MGRHLKWYFLCLMTAALLPAEGLTEEVRLEADRIEGEGTLTKALGDVQAHFSGYKLCAGELEYDRDSGLMRATQEVRVVDDDIEITGAYFDYNVRQRQGHIDQFTMRSADSGLYVTGQEMTLNSGYAQARDISITSCPQESLDWQLYAGSMQTVEESQQMIIKNAVLEIAGVPVFYIPYSQFYYGREQQTGFLQPDLNLGSDSGFGFETPYYWKLADNYDFTLTPNYRSKHGLEIGSEFRALTAQSLVTLQVAFAFSDEEIRGREQVNYQYHHNNWRLDLAAENVSDRRYLRDYAGGDEKSTRTLPRTAALSYQGDNFTLRGAVEHFQSLDKNLTAPYRAVPQLEMAFYDSQAQYDWQTAWQYSRFNHSTLADGSRTVWRGKMRYYHQWEGLSLSPAAGVHAADYQGGGNDGTFFVPYVRLDVEKNYHQLFALSGQYDYLRLQAAAVAAREDLRQNQAPLYDTTARDLTVENLFEENRFVGDDRAPDAKFVVYGGSYNLFNQAYKRRRFFIGAAQRYYFQETAVHTGDEDDKIDQGFGNLLLNTRLLLGQRWDIAAAAEWDVREHTTREFYAEAHGSFSPDNLLHLRYSVDEEESLIVGGSIKINNRLEIAAQTDYLLDEDRFTRSRLAWRLRDSCNCWTISFMVSDVVTSRGNNETEYSIGFELAGLGNIGNDYESLLDDLR